ncbi:unnamed protein product, partial [marine sediment metagenome]
LGRGARMSFVRAKKFSNGRVYFYLVESYRDQGKVKQRVLRYLGKDPRKGVSRGRITGNN